MLPIARADMLRRQADNVMEMIRLYDILLPYGEVFPTGSYFLDVMVYPDIDLYIPNVNLGQLFDIGAQLACCELVSQVVFEKTDNQVLMPDGLYLKVRVKFGDWGRPWKIDIWSLDKKVISQKMEDMRHFQVRLTQPLREQIVRYKLSIMTPEKRTPMYSGYYIYKAFIDEGLTDFESVNRYLIDCGIRLSE